MDNHYSTFWSTVHDFQPLIAVAGGLVSVLGAIFGIWLKSNIDEVTESRKKRKSRAESATTLRSLIVSEKTIPDYKSIAYSQ